jgi:alpha-N-arabinofuranosidase
MRSAQRVSIACLAQLVNVIAPITTSPDGLFLQTTYYPYAWALQCARGDVLDLAVDSPTYDVRGIDPVPYIDASATLEKGGPVSLFILNRDLNKPRDVEIVWREGAPQRVQFSQVLTGTDLKASNSLEKPRNVTPQALEPGKTGAARTVLRVPARSYAVIQWSSLA